jgi:hypothetical protein
LLRAQALGCLAFNANSPWRKRCAFYPLIIDITNYVILIVVVIEEKEGWGDLLPVVFVIVVTR